MDNTRVILGPPGTGKTTRLLNLVDDYMKKGYKANDIGFISFTKKSVTEAKTRAATKFNVSDRYFTYFRTIHSTAFYQLSMKKADVMNRSHYVELGKDLGYKMTGIHRQDQMLYEMSKGDQLVFIESLARMMMKNYADMYSEMNPDFDLYELLHFAESYIAYKKSHLLVDFTDMLEEYLLSGIKPPLKVLFVDEAQDLCKLQWKIVEQMSNSSLETWIAGDDDQAIFRWSGADIDYFQKIAKENKTEILHQSYRLPIKIQEFSNKLIQRVYDRVPKEFKATKETGTINYVSSIEDIDMSKGEWLILVRNSYLIPDTVTFMRIMGYPYETISYSINEDDGIKAAVSWERLRKGFGCTPTEVSNMLEYFGNNFYGNQKFLIKNREETIDMKFLCLNRIIDDKIRDEVWHKVLTKIPVDDREYFISIRRRGETLTGKSRIKISTIHGAKGGEAENVVLFTDMSNRTYKGMMENEDDELRVFYVGITRTKKNLFIVENRTPTYMRLE